MPNSSETLSFGKLKSLEFPPETHIIGNGILKKNSKLVVAASPKSYKSFTTNTMQIQLLTGGHLFGAYRNHANTREDCFHINPVEKVLVFEQELGLEDNRDRLYPFYQSLNQADQAIMDAGLFLHSCDFDLRLDEEKGIERVGNIIAAIQPQVVIFDPLIKFHRVNENDPSEMNAVMCGLSRMQQQLNFSSILIHHHNKSSEKSGLDQLRGGSSIAGDLDTCMQLSIYNRQAAMVKVETILKRGKPIPEYILKLNPETMKMEFSDWHNVAKREKNLSPKLVQ